tara:strand:+ start:120 stop:332 length:213 start_codon:yes stop_codon:yes gene_type:complete
MINQQLKNIVQQAAKEKGITGIMALAEVAPISYPRVRRVWDGLTDTKISDYIEVMKVLGYDEIKFVKRGA